MEKMKACPACKYRNIWLLDDFTGRYKGEKSFWCKCPRCGHKGETTTTTNLYESYEHAQARAIQYWNTRTNKKDHPDCSQDGLQDGYQEGILI